MALAQGHSTWPLGFLDEVWWSRLAQPSLHPWTAADQPPLRLIEQAVAPHEADPKADPKALACSGVLLRHGPATEHEADHQRWRRFVDGRPVSAMTTPFLDWCCADWCCARLEQQHILVWALVWDNASWHVSKAVRCWLRTHHRQVKQRGHGVRIRSCSLPLKSPWLNPIEPKWVHGKRAIVEPARVLSAHELAERVCGSFHCPHDAHLIQEQAS